MQKVLDDAVAAGVVPGVAAAVTDAHGAVFEGAAGVTELGGSQAVDADTVFWIASMTKPVTSVAAMQLVEQGKLQLDAPMGDLLPELKNPQILQDGKLRPATKPITLKHLLTHTAGYSTLSPAPNMPRIWRRNPSRRCLARARRWMRRCCLSRVSAGNTG